MAIVIFTIKTSPRLPLQRTKINTGTPWQGFDWEVLNGFCHPFSREHYSQSLRQVDTLLLPQNRFRVNAMRHPPRFDVPTRQPDLDNLYEEGVHLDYMDFDPGESNPKPRGFYHHCTNIGTQPQTASSQAKHTTPKDASSAKPPPSFNRLSTSVGAASSASLQPIDRVMVLERRPDAPRLSNTGPSTTPNNNSLYNRQLDYTPSLPSQPRLNMYWTQHFGGSKHEMLRERWMQSRPSKQRTIQKHHLCSWLRLSSSWIR